MDAPRVWDLLPLPRVSPPGTQGPESEEGDAVATEVISAEKQHKYLGPEPGRGSLSGETLLGVPLWPGAPASPL